MATTLADRNLLLGILAIQVRFVSREDLIAGMNAWLRERDKPLGELLVARGAMKPEHRDLVEKLVDEDLKLYGDDALRSLASADSPSSIEESIAARVDDPDIQERLVAVRQIRPAEQPRSTDAITTIDLKPTAHQPNSAPRALGGRFQILRPHAEGGLGVVSVALDTELNREVALKQIKPTAAERADYRARFVLEAEITGALEHPGIVPVYSLGHDASGQPFYAMRFIRGDSLADAIAAFQRRWPSVQQGRSTEGSRDLEFRSLLRRVIDICNAIGYAHSRGVLHRDLKPGNVMLGKYGETLVVDWGLAKPAGRVDAAAALDVEAALDRHRPAKRPIRCRDRPLARRNSCRRSRPRDAWSCLGHAVTSTHWARRSFRFLQAAHPSTATTLARYCARCSTARSGRPARTTVPSRGPSKRSA